MTAGYDDKFFAGHHAGSVSSARVIVPMVREMVRFSSVVDVGCGTGTWLSVFAETGTGDYLGVDGAWVDQTKLSIPKERFAAADLARPPKIGRRFDLAVSVEVAEHLPKQASGSFVEWLTELAPVVLFSAAIPGQGGTGHVNEQWPDSWAELFNGRGYACIDALRPRIWGTAGVQWWYAQNILMFADRTTIAEQPRLAELALPRGESPQRLVHPGCLDAALRQPLTLTRVVREGPGALRRAISTAVRGSR